jgi:hypothetical protein
MGGLVPLPIVRLWFNHAERGKSSFIYTYSGEVICGYGDGIILEDGSGLGLSLHTCT